VKADYEQRLDFLEQLLPSQGRLLDFACGAGHFFERAQARGWDAHGTEIGAWASDAARQRGLRNLHIGKLRDLHFPDASFDIVHAAQVFEHLANPNTELAEIRRILRPGGILYVDVPNYHTIPIMLRRDDFMLNTPPQHVNYFSPANLKLLLESGGYSRVRLSSAGGLKWENLLGRPVTSEIQDAYTGGAAPSSTGPAATPALTRAWSRTLKKVLKATVVEPFLYRRLRLGMVLAAVATRE
jgi:SAM-dependent methyltransferase